MALHLSEVIKDQSLSFLFPIYMCVCFCSCKINMVRFADFTVSCSLSHYLHYPQDKGVLDVRVSRITCNSITVISNGKWLGLLFLLMS
jgi:hypothetical protein